MPISLAELDALDVPGFLAALGPVVENSPEVVAPLTQQRPFARVADLIRALATAVRTLDASARHDLLNAHPELAGAEAQAGIMTRASTSEQQRLGLLALTRSELERLQALNDTYRKRFGFPFIVALHRLANRDAVFDALEARLQNDAEQETAIALDEIVAVIDGRVRRLVTDDAPLRRAAVIDPNPFTSTSGD